MDYRIYRLSVSEKLKYGASYMLLFLVIGKLFYDSWIVSLFGIIIFPFLFHRKEKKLAKERREKLSLETGCT